MLSQLYGKQVAQAQPARTFRDATREQKTPIAPQSITAFGDRVTFQLPVTGFLSGIMLQFSGTLTTGAGTPAGSWNQYPMKPGGIFKEIKLYTSENVNLLRLHGQELMYLNLLNFRCGSPNDDFYDVNNSNNRAGVFLFPSGTPDAATAYNVAGWLYIPVATDDLMMLGLQLAQNLEIRTYLDVTLESAAAIHGVTGVTVTPSVTIRPSVRFFAVPPAGNQFPDLRFTQIIDNEKYPVTIATGDSQYRPVPGNVYLGLYGIPENSSTLVLVNGVTYMSQLQYKYAQNVIPYSETYLQHLAWNKYYHGITLPDGCFAYDWTKGFGIPGIVDTRDWINTAQQTDVEHVITWAGVSTTNLAVNYIRRQL